MIMCFFQIVEVFDRNPCDSLGRNKDMPPSAFLGMRVEEEINKDDVRSGDFTGWNCFIASRKQFINHC